MTTIDPQHFINELRFDIQTDDLLKARLVMAHFAEMDASTQRRALFELSRAPDAFVFSLLVDVLANSPGLGDTCPPLKTLLLAKASGDTDLLSRTLMRAVQPGTRVVLAEVAGQIRLSKAVPILLGILGEERHEKVLYAVIVALGRIGNASATTAISEFLYSGSVELVIAAIHALGLLATPTALQRLFDKLGADSDLDKMILDVFTCSQEPEALKCLNALLSARHVHLRNAGKQCLLDIGRKAIPTLIENLSNDDPDLLIHSLNVMGAIGDASAIAPIRKLLHNEPENANVRFAAYEALGLLPGGQGAFTLAQGLNDPVDNVRAAAAAAVDHNYNAILAAGIKNMVRSENTAERPISRTIMDAECDAIFNDLIEEAGFCEFAVRYLSRQAHADIRGHFVDLLIANGRVHVAAAIQEQSITPKCALKVFAVDDSRMILNIYRCVLHNLGCDPMLFEFPAEAIAHLDIVKPDLIFTDLNMPDISGVALTQAVRQRYTREQVPIIMVTTQNESQDNAAALQAGVNAILNKPFNEKALRNAMQAQLGRSVCPMAVEPFAQSCAPDRAGARSR